MNTLQLDYKSVGEDLPLSIVLKGDLTSLDAIKCKEELMKLIDGRSTDSFLDISNVSEMDVAGLNALLAAHKVAQRNGSKLVIVSSENNPADEFLHLSKFNRYFNLRRGYN